MTEQTPNTDTTQPANTAGQTGARERADTLRYIPPVAALGTAFVLQVILITDLVGGALADSQTTGHRWPWYLFAGLLGVAVASCAEGGAAYLMDLYDRHLLVRDTVWLLRFGMVVYVAGSAAAIHWWLDHRGLPTVVSWLLAGMSASALFLWSRGSRWRNRQAMLAAGQIDPALPRLPMAAKVLHPWRWLITLYLISWEPVATTDEARARYEQWRTAPHWWRRTPKQTTQTRSRRPEASNTARPVPDTQTPAQDSAGQTPHPVDTVVRSIGSARGGAKPANGQPSADEAANLARLKDAFADWRKVMPSVRDITGVIGGSNYTGQKYQRLIAAARKAEQQTPTPTGRDTADDPEELSA